jgi:hypothetical protein
MAVANTLVYYDKTKITTVKKFYSTGPWIKAFYAPVVKAAN